MARVTRIRNVDWVVAWDAAAGRHVYLRDADVVLEGNVIRWVGPAYPGPADETVDGRGRLVMPGLVDLHAHPTTEPAFKGIREEHGVPAMYMTGLYERVVAFRLDEAGRAAAAEVAYSELLASGVTSLVDLSAPFPGWLDLLGRSGLRGFVAPAYASARWQLASDHEVGFHWDEAAGRRGFEAALRLIEEAERHPSGRLTGVVYPAQLDTCSETLLRDSVAAARRLGRPLVTHAAQSVLEFQLMVRRHGTTPIQWASAIGLLGAGTILGHALFVDEHSWLHWWSRRDLDLLAETRTAVAHCPTPFARYGQVLEHLGRYLRRGITVGLGTDVSPHNLLEEMRWAAVLGRIAAGDLTAVTTADVLHAATVGGARALGRDDLGRLLPGCKADLVLVDLTDVSMRPARDPLRSLIYTAAERAVRDVFVDGVRVVADGKVLTLDRAAAAERLAEGQRRMLEAVPRHDHAGRTAEAIAPLCLPLVPGGAVDGRPGRGEGGGGTAPAAG
ncbi:MAG TPA: amidohydrolase family protein [Methylomirabilota bacterium]|nr:amidohydrolase family protein [Methylomirabilota bacterium]